MDVAVNSADWPLVGFIVMVDDFRNGNGATRFVPGSHKWAHDWKDATTNHRPAHDQQVAACGTAGSVIVFDGSTWHGANFRTHHGDLFRALISLEPELPPQIGSRSNRRYSPDWHPRAREKNAAELPVT